ncbi:MAG: MbcA/ParS/Xre antitoxin family protein [Polyangiaceae bacterium]|jgi:hypothetical protein
MNRERDPFLFPRATTSGFLTPEGAFAVRRLCSEFGVEPADFARLTGRTTESVAKLFHDETSSPRGPRTVQVLREMLQLQNVLQVVGLPPSEMKGWMHMPLPAFEGKTPRELISEGRGQELVARLMAYSSGNVAP